VFTIRVDATIFRRLGYPGTASDSALICALSVMLEERKQDCGASNGCKTYEMRRSLSHHPSSAGNR
jgi:hypothetical protein